MIYHIKLSESECPKHYRIIGRIGRGSRMLTKYDIEPSSYCIARPQRPVELTPHCQLV